jgi:enamine deaminase RidA (YjgF/YER057c/UK114 family)
LKQCNIYITDMDTYAAMNKACTYLTHSTYVAPIPPANHSLIHSNITDLEMVHEKPARTCVCVKELPFKAGVEIECVAHL